MYQSLFAKQEKALLVLCLSILLFCALIQYGSFSGLMLKETGKRYISSRNSVVYTYYEAEQYKANIIDAYGEEVVQIEISDSEIGSTASSGSQRRWIVRYTIDTWVRDPPILADLLSETTNAPLAAGTAMLLLFAIVFFVERDYRPNKSILTLLRLPRPRSRYLLGRLMIPTSLCFFFWSIQFLVIIAQNGRYLSALPETTLRSAGMLPWVFDYYRILYPVTEPIWFPATVCVFGMIPLAVMTLVLIAKGGMKSWIYGLVPAIGGAAAVLTFGRVSHLWWIAPVLLIAVYGNSVMLLNKGQIVQ